MQRSFYITIRNRAYELFVCPWFLEIRIVVEDSEHDDGYRVLWRRRINPIHRLGRKPPQVS